MTREEVLKLIEDKNKNYRVTFTKQNGDKRIMIFTRSHEMMEDMNLVPSGTGSTSDVEALRVMELCDDGKAQWRSFKYSSIISLEEYKG
jgi:hypothetical protein